MLHIALALFQCLTNGKMIVDSSALDVHVFFSFAQEKSCSRVSSGLAQFAYEDSSGSVDFTFKKQLSEHEIYSSFHFTCADYSGAATCAQAMKILLKPTSSSNYLMLNQEYVFPRISGITSVVLSFIIVFIILIALYSLVFNRMKGYIGFFERACVFFNFQRVDSAQYEAAYFTY